MGGGLQSWPRDLVLPPSAPSFLPHLTVQGGSWSVHFILEKKKKGMAPSLGRKEMTVVGTSHPQPGPCHALNLWMEEEGVDLKPPLLTSLLAPRCCGNTASTCQRRSSSTCSSTMTNRSLRRFPTTTSCVPSCSRNPGRAVLGTDGASGSVPKTSKNQTMEGFSEFPQSCFRTLPYPPPDSQDRQAPALTLTEASLGNHRAAAGLGRSHSLV